MEELKELGEAQRKEGRGDGEAEAPAVPLSAPGLSGSHREFAEPGERLIFCLPC